jgi:hypothetical protein
MMSITHPHSLTGAIKFGRVTMMRIRAAGAFVHQCHLVVPDRVLAFLVGSDFAEVSDSSQFVSK